MKPTTVHILLSLAVSSSWVIRQLDVYNAFLNGRLAETVYMKQPPGYVDKLFPSHVCLLQRSLYGLKQVPHAWFKRMHIYCLLVLCPRRRTSLCLYMLLGVIVCTCLCMWMISFLWAVTLVWWKVCRLSLQMLLKSAIWSNRISFSGLRRWHGAIPASLHGGYSAGSNGGL